MSSEHLATCEIQASHSLWCHVEACDAMLRISSAASGEVLVSLKALELKMELLFYPLWVR